MRFVKVYVVKEQVSTLVSALWGINFVSSAENSFDFCLDEDGRNLEVFFMDDEVKLEDTFKAMIEHLNIPHTSIEVDYDVSDLTSAEYSAFDAGMKALQVATPIPIEYCSVEVKDFPYYLNEAMTNFARTFKKSIERKS